jgi:hypothetical protein
VTSKLAVDVEGTLGCFVLANAVTARQEDVVIVLLICLVGAMIASALLISRVAHWQLRKRQTEADNYTPAFPMGLFDAPRRWLAVRTQRPELVQAALGVHNARVCSWSDALAGSHEPRLFISPPLRGWVLVMGCDLPDPSDDIDSACHFVSRLSAKLGEVQFFTRVRALSHHGWVRLDRGKVVRAYVWAGETLWNQGTPSQIEQELKLRLIPYTESSETLPYGERELLATNTEKVLRLAANWSVDPTTVEPATLEGKGIAGALVPSKLH